MKDKVQKIREFLIGMAGATCCDAKIKKNIEKNILPFVDSLQKEPVIQNVITESVGVSTGAVELANIPGKRSPTNEEIGDYDHKAVMESLHPQLKEDPISEDLETELNKYIKGHFTIDTEQLYKFGIDEKDYMYSMDKSDMLALVEHFTKWQEEKEHTCYEEAFEDGAKWKKEQMMAKAIDAEVLENYDGKVLEYDDSILNEKLSDCKVFDKVKIIVIKEE